MNRILAALGVAGIITLLCIAGARRAVLESSGADIESPIQNTCQSADLLPEFPKCPTP